MTGGESRPTPYADLNGVLGELVRSVRTILADDLVGAYLQGSFAVGDFDEHSDVDFIVVTREPVANARVEALQMMHARIYDLECPWAQHLEGSYFPAEALRDHTKRDHPLWYLDHGSRSLIESTHCNSVVVRWTLREHGVVLGGPPPESLIDPIDVGVLRHDIASVITGWGQEILDDPDRYANRFYQGFIVLNYCRMLRDLRDGTTGSKRAGADWAREHLDPSFSGLIDRAWSTRPDPATSVRQPADPEDHAATLAFVRLVMDESRD